MTCQSSCLKKQLMRQWRIWKPSDQLHGMGCWISSLCVLRSRWCFLSFRLYPQQKMFSNCFKNCFWSTQRTFGEPLQLWPSCQLCCQRHQQEEVVPSGWSIWCHFNEFFSTRNLSELALRWVSFHCYHHDKKGEVVGVFNSHLLSKELTMQMINCKKLWRLSRKKQILQNHCSTWVKEQFWERVAGWGYFIYS